MAKSGTQISSLHLAIAAGGGVLLYAALRGVSPATALKDIASGSPPSVSTEGRTITGTAAGAIAGSLITDAAGQLDIPGGSGSTPWKGVYRLSSVPKQFQKPTVFVAALQTHSGEKYSQAKRWQRGFSDCSSLVGKALLEIGVEPPGSSVTGDYLASGQWVKVGAPRLGDIAVNSRHMAVFTSATAGIGQQNSRRNVERGPMSSLMANTGDWEIRRYRGWA